MFNRYYGYQGQKIILTAEDYAIMAAADDRSRVLRLMVAAEGNDYAAMHWRVENTALITA